VGERVERSLGDGKPERWLGTHGAAGPPRLCTQPALVLPDIQTLAVNFRPALLFDSAEYWRPLSVVSSRPRYFVRPVTSGPIRWAGSAPLEQRHDVLVHGVWGLEICEVATLFEHEQAPARHRVRDTGGECEGDEVVRKEP
jgi:hypothetical protein